MLTVHLQGAPVSWRVCSSCRAAIGFQATYWECSVSTCTRPRTGLFFCSVACWEAHLPEMRHREAWAVEKRAPSQAEWARREKEAEEAGDSAVRAAERSPITTSAARTAPPLPVGSETGRRVLVAPPAPSATAAPLADADASEVLVVVSKLKKYIRDRSTMNTSDGVIEVLSDHLREVCDRAIRKAGEEGRKTVLDRDVKAILR
jgi:hypothetical protein